MTEEKTKTRVGLDMPCRCDADGKAGCDELRARVSKKIGLTDDDDFVSAVVASLWWDFSCEVNGMYMDMWFGVRAENETETFFVPCDRVEDGLAAILEYHQTKQETTDESES